MKKQSDYWAKNVLSWEKGAYYHSKEIGGKFRLADRLSKYFRGDSIYKRADHALHLIKDFVKDQQITDVGCASGRFARNLINSGAKTVIGIDVSEAGIDLAKTLAAQDNMENRIEFILQDATIPNSPLPEAYLTIALGVIEYFDENSLKIFLSNMRSPYYFFSFPQLVQNPKPSLRHILRSIYLKIQACPGIYFYSNAQFNEICSEVGLEATSKVITYKGHTFITNLDMENQ